ncbi:MAG TPA: PAN domain-containing protein [Pyrinomonadaceae bacterium]|nr:PAN domain-containing protein [Pyrinomonadaceae bacterium]
MKICPTCRKTYKDPSLVFCLDDGASLREIRDSDPDATLHLAQPPGPTVRAPDPSPRPTVPSQATITARPDQYQVATAPRASDSERESKSKSALPWIFGIVVVLAVAGVLVAWLVSRSGDNGLTKNESPTPQPSASARPTLTPKVEPTPMFAVLNNTSFNGSRITYYPRPSFELCQADCAANTNCQGFTWIRPGAYNPGDSAMCYLMSEVTDRISGACCISAVRN